MRPLENQVAVITGAARGIGLAVAERLAGDGATVILTDLLRESDYQAVLPAIRRLSPASRFLPMDVRSEASVEVVVASLECVDVLVNCAGITRRGPAESYAMSDWEEVLAVNLTGAFRCCQLFGQGMLARGQGSIVNVTSVNGIVVREGAIGYGVSKAALIHLTRSLALEWAGRGVRVNAVAPSVVETAMTADLFARPEYLPAKLAKIPLGRPMDKDDVAEAIRFLAGPQSKNITGHVLVIDGGYSLP